MSNIIVYRSALKLFDIQNDSLLFYGTYLFNTGVNKMMFLMLKINKFYHEYGVILLYIIVQTVI